MTDPTSPRHGVPMPRRSDCQVAGICELPSASPLSDGAVRCEHFDAIAATAPTSGSCAGCDATGHVPIALRVCLTCGHVGCCEDSPGRHAVAHFEATGHPMIASYERLETWGWCYVHGRYFDPMPGPLPQRPYVWQTWLSRWLPRRRAGA